MSHSLTEEQRAIVAYYRDHGTESESRRAQIILMHLEDASTQHIAAAVSLSTSQVRHWRREWEKRGIDIFPPLPDENDVYETEQAEPRPGVDTPRLVLDLRDTVGMLPDDPMAEAGRKALFFNFERMLLHEPGSRLGEDIEAVHDMRVATRRMRSAFRLFAPFFKATTIKPFRQELRHIAGVLGTVRDLEVFLEKAQRFADSTPDTDLTPLMQAWTKRLDKARDALIEELDSKRFARFVNRFYAFLITPGKGAVPLPEPGDAVAYQVRHVAPRLIYEHYERVRAYEPVLEDAPVGTLHALRIDFKRLRYAVEFFEEVLGPEAKSFIKEIKTMQDHLGDLNDAEVAGGVLRDFVDRHNAQHSGTPLFMRPDISGVVVYAAATEAERQRLLDTFPAAWAAFTREDVRRDLALAVAVL
jgi:CHAD domain-containing protein